MTLEEKLARLQDELSRVDYIDNTARWTAEKTRLRNEILGIRQAIVDRDARHAILAAGAGEAA
jgi:hypothetical protein